MYSILTQPLGVMRVVIWPKPWDAYAAQPLSVHFRNKRRMILIPCWGNNRATYLPGSYVGREKKVTDVCLQSPVACNIKLHCRFYQIPKNTACKAA